MRFIAIANSGCQATAKQKTFFLKKFANFVTWQFSFPSRDVQYFCAREKINA
jgi:hypothetical protein